MDKKYFVRKVDEMKRITQTAGRNALKEFSLEFAHFNDDILFGENWNNQDIDLKDVYKRQDPLPIDNYFIIIAEILEIIAV